MSSLIEKIKSNKKILIGGALVSLAGGVLYYLLNQNPNEKTKQQQNNTNNTTVQNNTSTNFDKDMIYLKAVENIKLLIKSEMQMGQLSKKTVSSINQLVIKLLKRDYLRLLKQNRDNRRKYLNNINLYAEFILGTTKESESLIENASLTVLRDVELDLNVYEKQCENLAKQDPSFPMHMIYMLEMLKMQINPQNSKNVDKNMVKEFLRYQIDFLKNLNVEDMNIIPSQQMIIKQSFASDHASMKFNFEEEDILRNISILQDPEIMQLQQQMQMMLMGGHNQNTFF